MRILFFIESLRSGGKERRLLELVKYLNERHCYEMILVLTEEDIHYRYAYDLIGDVKILKRKYLKKDPSIFIRFFGICKAFKPDIIHTWGSMLAFYALPVSMLMKIPHINGHIADCPVNLQRSGFHYNVTRIGFRYSDVILANSFAGLQSYNVKGSKCRVIHNGLDLKRFDNLKDRGDVRREFRIKTKYAVIMVASFTSIKKYDQFLEVAEATDSLRTDVTFIGVGDTAANNQEFERIRRGASSLRNLHLLPKLDRVEDLINACDIGLLFTKSEGISNSILECMACGLPVIASDAGGMREIIVDRENGFLITNESKNQIAHMISDLLEREAYRSSIGEKAKATIANHFSIEKMGSQFEDLYNNLLTHDK